MISRVRHAKEMDAFDLILSKTWWDMDDDDYPLFYETDVEEQWWSLPRYARCVCGHRWHPNLCKAWRWMSVAMRGRSRQCECLQSLLG